MIRHCLFNDLMAFNVLTNAFIFELDILIFFYAVKIIMYNKYSVLKLFHVIALIKRDNV